ncbi:Citrate lyase subunit beta-like protein, mitochondrial [Toxocara canis]|uniref:Citramalyl-CoA lyase, mitochondrial n=2 Tax=Toxocara canis TaxID=6265 RepID=A0A0B2V485_TOXCA|nr:Citrate lyase subunit beta-like protein, mitochondrial [Toxocara canis]VDM41396.1 unnamed protein product [Toxocara canis]
MLGRTLARGRLLSRCCSLPCSTFCTSSDANRTKGRSRYVPRRALLYVPGSNEKMLSKVPQIQVDCLVLEMEDGVAASAKAQARQNIRKYLDELPAKGVHKCLELGVRVNSVASQLVYEDVKELAKSPNMPEAFMVPKVDSIEDLAAVFDAFRATYGEKRITEADTRLVIWIESARALLDMPRILNAAVNLNKSTGFFKIDGVVFGSDDFCADIGATRTKEGTENMYARQRFVTCCKAFSLQAIDSVYIDIKDKEGLKTQCEQGRIWGFDGKQVIHPSQIDVVQSAFLPSVDKVEWARELMREFIEHEKAGKGAFTFRGHMIDRPLLLQAMNVVKMVDRVAKGRDK